MKRLFILCILCLLATTAACRDDDSSRIEGDLTQAENDDRVGQKIIRCGLDEVDQATIDAILAASQVSRTTSTASRGPGSVFVPVIVHVIASGPSEAEGNVSDSAIAAQIGVLNLSFGGAQGGPATPFQFGLQGITRTIDPALAAMTIGSIAERVAKSALREGDAATLNIYLANPTDGTLGWATFPWDFANDPLLDGVVLLHTSLPGGSLPPYNEGDTGVHEVGHWLGLFHTFQGTCSSQNDTISDTPAEARPAFGCPIGRDSCGGSDAPDAVSNFMNYSDDFCLTEFSPEQSARIDQLSQTFRGL